MEILIFLTKKNKTDKILTKKSTILKMLGKLCGSSTIKGFN